MEATHSWQEIDRLLTERASMFAPFAEPGDEGRGSVASLVQKLDHLHRLVERVAQHMQLQHLRATTHHAVVYIYQGSEKVLSVSSANADAFAVTQHREIPQTTIECSEQETIDLIAEYA